MFGAGYFYCFMLYSMCQNVPHPGLIRARVCIPSLRRSSHSTGLCLRLHRRHMRCRLPAGVRLLLLPPGPDASGTDHKGVVLDPPTLQPRSPGQPASHPGPSLVPLLAVPAHPLPSPWRWYKLPGHRTAGARPVTAETTPRVFA